MRMATCSSATATETGDRLVVRDAVPGDAACIAAIYAHEVLHGTSSYEIEAVPPAGIVDRMATGIAAGYPWLVALTGRGMAGYAYASGYRSRPGYRWTVEDSVYVSPSYQGRGVGRCLLGALIQRCTEGGFRQMIAVIGDAENRASIALHERAGFVEAARFPGIGRKHGRWFTNVQMLRALGEGASSPPFADDRMTA